MKGPSSGPARKARARRRPPSDARVRPRAAVTKFVPLLIVAACLAVYANSLNGPFQFDDQKTIEESSSIRQLWPLSRVLLPMEPGAVTGRPLVNLSFAVNYAIGGLEARGYHIFNVGIHVLAAMTLFGVLRRTFARLEAQRTEGGDPDVTALLCTLLWALHPLNSEVMNYLTQRTESMMGLFYLLAVYCAIRAIDARHARRWEIAAGVAALCGVASKEVALTAVFVIALWDRVFALPTFRAAWGARRHLYAMIAASCLLYVFIGRTVYGDTGELRVSTWTYLLNQGPMIVQYLKLAVWPSHLVFDYGVPQALTVRDVWPSLLVVAALLAATVAAFRLRPPVGFWGAWIVIILAPTSSVVPISTEVGAERRMYLPLIAVIVLLVTGADLLLRRLLRSTNARRRASWATGIVVLCVLATATIRRNAEYRTPLSIWQTVVDRRPQWRAHEHLSMHLRGAGRVDESIAHLRIAAADSSNSRHALAAALLERGDLAEAIVRFRGFIRDRPHDPEMVSARRELAAALMKSGDRSGAIDELRAVAAMRPDDVRSQLGLAAALEDSGNVEGAMEAYRTALRLQPNDLIALSNLGVLLASRGQVDEALALLPRAIALEPRAVGVRLQMTQLLLSRGRFDEAEAEARTLVAFAPDNAEAHNLLGVALANRERLPEAADQFAEALRLDPNHQQARANVAMMRQMRSQVEGQRSKDTGPR